jgi:endoglucanase
LILSALAFPSLLLVAEAAAIQRPFPQHTVYATGTIRPNHRTQAQQDEDVRAYYEDWKTNYLVDAGVLADGRKLYRVSIGKTNPGRTVSEGQGYGMFITVLMAGYDPDAQTLFDALWRFSRQYPSAVDSRLMSWQIPQGDDCRCSAFDGDADIAFALLLADAQWGSAGAIHYKNEARTVLAGILASTIGPNSRLPMLGDWVRVDHPTHNEYTPRSSDFMPGHFRAFGRATGDPVWTEVINASQAIITSLQDNYSPNTGLLPDFIVPTSLTDRTPKPAPPGFLEDTVDGDYYYNAGRDPWRLGTDAVLSGDPVSLAQTRRITRWARTATGANPLLFRSGYHLDGTPLPNSDYFSIFFVAPLMVAAMTDPSQQQWLNDLYDAVYATHEDYYEDSVAFLSLLTVTGNMWLPDGGRGARRRTVRH